MGTNFYWRTGFVTHTENVVLPTGEPYELRIEVDDMDPKIHLGKRSASGPYCFDCQITLCRDGEKGIHLGKSKWHERCPKCGAKKKEESLNESSGGVELGFAKPVSTMKKGVQSCSSFSWAQDRDIVIRVCNEKGDERIIVDEYGTEYTGSEFTEMLYFNCPVQYLESIGEQFS